MNKLTIFAVMVMAGCAGRCSPHDAVMDVAPVEATCVVEHSGDSGRGICLIGSSTLVCKTTGRFFHVASCHRRFYTLQPVQPTSEIHNDPNDRSKPSVD